MKQIMLAAGSVIHLFTLLINKIIIELIGPPILFSATKDEMIHVLINSGELQKGFVPKSIQPSPVNRDGLSVRIKSFCLFLYRDVTDPSD